MSLSFVYFILFLGFFSACTSIDPDLRKRANNRVEVADAMIRAQNYPGALKELMTAESEDPKNASVQDSLGRVYFAREKYELSEKHFLKALQLQPNFTQARNNLARAYIETDRYTRAEELLKVAVEDLTFSDYQITYANFGILEFKRNNFPKAIMYLKKSLEKDRENCETQVYLGRSILESGDLEGAVTQLDRSVSFCSQADSDSGHYYSAIALYRAGQIDKAQLRFEELLSLFPNGPSHEKAQKMIDIIKKGQR